MRWTIVALLGALVVLVCVPLAWHGGVGLDLSRFTEEWYKQCARIGEIILGFVLVHALLEHVKGEKLRAERERLHESLMALWSAACATSAVRLKAMLDGHASVQLEPFKEARARLVESFRHMEAVAECWAANASASMPAGMRKALGSFTREVRPAMRLVAARLENEDILPGRALKREEGAAVKRIGDFLTRDAVQTTQMR